MSGTFKIESDVPHPGLRGAKRLWPFAEMKIGDSFVVSADLHSKVVSAASQFGLRSGGKLKFSVLQSGGAYRCWRVA